MTLHCASVETARSWLAESEHQPLPEFLEHAAQELIALDGAAMSAWERLTILEELRPGLWHRLAVFERDHLARVLPFNAADQQRWQAYIEMWGLLLAGYLRSLAAADRGEDGVAGLAPLLLQRVLRQAVQMAIASFRAYHTVDAGLWQVLHEQIRRAQKADWMNLAVADPTVAMDARGTAAEAYLHLLLLDYSDPYAMTPRELGLASRWLERLARVVQLRLEPVNPAAETFLVVNLQQPQGLRSVQFPPDAADANAGTPQFVDTAPLLEQLKRLLAKLELGISPEDLYLGPDCTHDEAEALLGRLVRRFRISRRRSLPRRVVNEPASIALGLLAIHRYLTQRAVPDGHGGPHLSMPNDPADDAHSSTAPLLALSESQILDQSPGGLGLLHKSPANSRLHCHQILALIGSREVLLASVRWLSMDSSAALRFGVKVIPGRPQPALMVSSTTEAGTYERALLLPAMPALSEPEALITAPGTFFQDRELRLWVGADASTSRQIILLERVEIGSDYERIRFRVQ